MALSPLTTTFAPDSDSPGRFVITAYGPGYIEVNGKQHTSPLTLQADTGPQPWSAKSLALLSAQDFESIAGLGPEVVIIGTGQRQVFLPAALLSPLSSHGIGAECMGSAAACRTYNILMSEGRRVVLALLFD